MSSCRYRRASGPCDPGALRPVGDAKSVPAAVPFGKALDPLVIGHQWAGKLDCSRDQKSIGWIPVLEVMAVVGAAGGVAAERHGLDAGSVEKPLDPSLGREIELDMPGIDKQRNLPGGDGTEVDRAAGLPVSVNQRTGRAGKARVAAIEPQ